MTLSDKQCRDLYENPAYKEEDVKEFIKDILQLDGIPLGIRPKIMKLAGDKLLE